MRAESICFLIEGGEKETVEFKKAATQVPDSFYESVCAFLNHKGGDILLVSMTMVRWSAFRKTD